jgi:site-specific DNA recombinase
MTIGALYIRVSTDEQVIRGTSLDNQEEAGKAYFAREKMTLFKIYRDEGFSGATLKRPGLQELLSDARKGLFNVVVVYKTDRLSRSIAQTVKIILEDLQGLGIAFKSITEPYDTSTPAGRMFFVQLASFADFEREVIKERSKIGRRRRAAEGKCMNARLPYGYGRDHEKNWIVNPEESKIYRQMVSWALEGLSSYTITDRLKEQGVFSRDGLYWNRTVVLRILKNPIYIGEGSYAGNKFKVPALISQTEYDSIRTGFRDNCHTFSHEPKHFFLLRGLLVCGNCGRRMVGTANDGRRAKNYLCQSKHKDIGPWCGLPHARQNVIDSGVWTLVSRLVKDSTFLKEALESSRLQGDSEAIVQEAELLTLDKAIQCKRDEMDRLLAVYTRSKIYSVADLDREAGKIRTELDSMERRRRQAAAAIEQHEASKTAAIDVEKALIKARSRIDQLNPIERREFLLRFVHEIKVTHDPAKGHIVDIDLQVILKNNKLGPSAHVDTTVQIKVSALAV